MAQATIKQKLAFKELLQALQSDKSFHMKEIMLKAGYTEITASKPQLNLTSKTGWQTLLAKIDDSKLLAELYELTLDPDDKRAKLTAIQEIMKVTSDIPRLTTNQLFNKFKNDNDFLRSFTNRLLRIFGLRRELIPMIEPELIRLIDDELEPLFDIEVGKYTLKNGKLKKFASLAVKLAKMVREIEKNLVEEHRNRLNF